MKNFNRGLRCGLLSGTLCALLLCVLTAVLQLFFDLSDGALSFIAIAILCISSFCAAYFSTQLCRSHGLWQGALCGLLVFGGVFFLSLLFGSRPSYISLERVLFCLVFGTVGGIRGVNTKKTKL